MKVCTKCKIEKEDSSFSIDKKRMKLRSWCNKCVYEKVREWNIKNREKITEYQANYRKTYNYAQYRKQYYQNPDIADARTAYYKSYWQTPKGQIIELKKRLRNAKKESTREKLQQKINLLLLLPHERESNKYTSEQLLDLIRNFVTENGRAPNRREIKQATTIKVRFGSWNNALRLCGITPKLRHDHTPEELIASLKAYYAAHGRSPSMGDTHKSDLLFDANTYIKKLKCKTWADVLETAGLPIYFEISSLTKLSDAELLKVVKRFMVKYNNSTQDFYNLHAVGLPSHTILTNRFGSWNNMLQRLNLPLNFRKYSEAQLLEYFYKAKTALGHVPSSTQLEKQSGIPFRNFTTKFGSYNAFLKKIGEEPQNLTPAVVTETNEELIVMYKQFSIKNGYKKGATARALNNSPAIYNYDVFASRFGGLRKLRELCNFP